MPLISVLLMQVAALKAEAEKAQREKQVLKEVSWAMRGGQLA